MTITTLTNGVSQGTLLFDGAESTNGRAMMVISALYHTVQWISAYRIVFANVTDPNVAIALAAFTYDTGEPVETLQTISDEDFRDVTLYAGVAFRSAAHMRIDAAAAARVPVLLAIQYPERRWTTPSTIMHARAAFDPGIFAQHLAAVAMGLAR